jgi:protein involved in polysaccharide export with SLBB domain
MVLMGLACTPLKVGDAFISMIYGSGPMCNLGRVMQVAPDGTINMYFLGRFKVAGMTLRQAELALGEDLAVVLEDKKIQVSLRRISIARPCEMPRCRTRIASGGPFRTKA